MVRMEHTEIFGLLRTELAAKFEVGEATITEETMFVQDLDADSLDLLELIISLRELFGVEVEDGEVKALLSELARFLPGDGSTTSELSDDELIAVTQRLRVGTFVRFIEERRRVAP